MYFWREYFGFWGAVGIKISLRECKSRDCALTHHEIMRLTCL